jgi:glycerol kinase
MLFDTRLGRWSEELLKLFDIRTSILPEVRDCSSEFGLSDAPILGATAPLRGVAGDQQAAMVGQACFQPGMLKATYGTGCFALLNTGSEAVVSKHRLLTTIGYQLDGKRTYALEGAIFIAGAAVQWLRDGIGALSSAAESGPMAAESDPSQDVVLVPAFVGLGAPHWDAEARGALFGLTRATEGKNLRAPRSKASASRRSICRTRCGEIGELWETRC